MEPARLAELFGRDVEQMQGAKKRLALHMHPLELLALQSLLRMAEAHPFCDGSLLEFARDLARRCESVATPTLAVRAGLAVALPREPEELEPPRPRTWPAKPAARELYGRPGPKGKVTWRGKLTPEAREAWEAWRETKRRGLEVAGRDGDIAGRLGWGADANPFSQAKEWALWDAWKRGWTWGNGVYLRGLEPGALWP